MSIVKRLNAPGIITAITLAAIPLTARAAAAESSICSNAQQSDRSMEYTLMGLRPQNTSTQDTANFDAISSESVKYHANAANQFTASILGTKIPPNYIIEITKLSKPTQDAIMNAPDCTPQQVKAIEQQMMKDGPDVHNAFILPVQVFRFGGQEIGPAP
ncbi:MAG TPA: hypothetical protein VFR09_01860 [Alphaproteobacteria bacterium]|nr:hypothetical protein [Alphaproteobacteria bacterium]